jgi:hypothetical protein
MAFDLQAYDDLIGAVVAATDPHAKGRSLEELCRYLFECLVGVQVEESDVQLAAEEVDLVLWNARLEEVLVPWETVILLEAKNWSAAVGAPMLDSFIAKLRRRGLKNGIFVAANGVTGTFQQGDGRQVGAVHIIGRALQEGFRVIVFTLDDLRRIRSLEDLRTQIKRKYCGLFVERIL